MVNKYVNENPHHCERICSTNLFHFSSQEMTRMAIALNQNKVGKPIQDATHQLQSTLPIQVWLRWLLSPFRSAIRRPNATHGSSKAASVPVMPTWWAVINQAVLTRAFCNMNGTSATAKPFRFLPESGVGMRLQRDASMVWFATEDLRTQQMRSEKILIADEK